MRPEEARTREYIHQRGTLSTPLEIHERVRQTFAATEEFLDSVSPGEERVRPAVGDWCIHETVDHIFETHRPAVEELRWLLRGQPPPDEPIRTCHQSERPLERPWPELVGKLKRLHADLLEILVRIPADFTSEAKAPVLMVVNVENPDGSEMPVHWIQNLNWKEYAVTFFRLHALDHLNQAKRTLKAVRQGVEVTT